MSVTTLEIQKPKPQSNSEPVLYVAQNDSAKITEPKTAIDKILPVQEGLKTKIVKDAPSNQTHYDQDQAPEYDIRTQLNMAWETFSQTYIPQEDQEEGAEQQNALDNPQLTALNTTFSEGIFKAFMKADALISNPNPDTTQEYKQAQREISQVINQNRTDPALRNNGALLDAVEAARGILNPVIRHPELEALARENIIKVVKPEETKPTGQTNNMNWTNLSVSEEIEISDVSSTAPNTEKSTPSEKPKPIQMVTLTLPGEPPKEKSRWGKLVSGVAKLFGRAPQEDPSAQGKTIEIYAKNSAIPNRYRNAINEYRRGNIESAYNISRGIGREDAASEKVHRPEQERQLLREGVNAGQPWAKEFIKIFQEQRAFDTAHRPQLRIQNALEDHKNGNLTRAYHTALKSDITQQEKAYLNQPGEQYKQLRAQFSSLVAEAQQARQETTVKSAPQNIVS